MTIETRQTNVPFSDDLRSYIEHRLDASLRRYKDRLGRIRVWLEDQNGPRHGDEDKVCRIVLEVEPRDQLIAEAKSHDAYAAVGKAVSRLHGGVRRLIDREHRSRQHRAARQ